MNSKMSNSDVYDNGGHITDGTYNKIVEWINEAAVSTDISFKIEQLHKVKEYLIQSNTSSSLLDNFLDEVLGFQNDRNAEIRKFIVGFIEEACKKDPEIIPKVVVNMSMLLQDSTAQVQKRVVQAAGTLYKVALKWLSKAKTVTDDMEAAWKVVGNIKQHIINMVDHDNDGIRTIAVKFLESLVLLQTYSDSEDSGKETDFSLEDVPFTLKIARRRKLEEEANRVFDLLVKYHGSAHISSVNLMTCMGSLVRIAKLRPIFIGKVVTALETLQINLPPTLTKSQVSSVRKHLKMQLLILLRVPASLDFHSNITTLLTDLGATYQEVSKAYPKTEDIKRHKLKRQQETAAAELAAATAAKKMRLEVDVGSVNVESEPVESNEVADLKKLETAVDVNERFVKDRMTPELAAQLVIQSMSKLPDTMPPHFSATYTPIAAAGTQGQILHVVRLIATQLTAANLGPGAKLSKAEDKMSSMVYEMEEEPVAAKSHIPIILSGDTERKTEDKPKAQTTLLATGGKLNRISKLKTLKLSEITKPLSEKSRNNMLIAAVQRIFEAEKSAVQGGATVTRAKIIANMASTFGAQVRTVALGYIAEDMKPRIELAIAWLYEEHSFIQGFNRPPFYIKPEQQIDNYNILLCDLLNEVIHKNKLDPDDREYLLNKLYLEVPNITDDALDLLRSMCCDETKSEMGLKLLQELIVRRPPKQMIFLNALLIHTSHENVTIRAEALTAVVNLYTRQDLSIIIEEYALFYLGFLKLPMPPDVLFGVDRGRPNKSDSWTEETIKVCLYLLLALLPHNHRMIHELAQVYVATTANIKRNILRLLEQPVRGMGMDSPELLTLVEQCPKGAETLVTRIIHVLTDRAAPSAELVSRVRDLYRVRVSDVRFLIPVLNGLTRDEVISALPKLIKLNPAVVKEVFNRLLGTHVDGKELTTPINPADLLVALHTIDPSKCELKVIIKATSMCFAERHAFTQEVLAVVLQQLMEITPLPTLLMRTVIQALALYPRLIGFVMNILQRLIIKQVWKQKKVWEGFIKCCQRTKPQSFQVLLQLPPPQLAEVFTECPDLRSALLDHVMLFTDHQRKHIPPTLMDVLLGNKNVIIDGEAEYAPPPELPQLVMEIKQEPMDVPPETGPDPPPPGIEIESTQ